MDRMHPRRTARGVLLVAASLGAGACLAPDAVPGTGHIGGGGQGGSSLVQGGEEIWARGFGHDGDVMAQHARDVAHAPDGTFVITMDFEYQLDVPGADTLTTAGSRDIAVIKYKADNSGAVWAKRFGDALEQVRTTVAVDKGGNVVVAGGFNGSIDFGNNPLPNGGQLDAFVAKLDAKGDHVWSKSFGDGGQQYATDVAVDGQGNVIVVGFAQGDVDFGGGVTKAAAGEDVFIAKYEPDGTFAWAQRVGRAASGQWMEPTATVATIGTDIVVAGSSGDSLTFSGTTLPKFGDNDVFVARLDPKGKLRWGQSYGAAKQSQRCFGIATTAAGRIALTGALEGAVDFGGGILTSKGDADVFAVELTGDGKHVWSRRYGTDGDQYGASITFDPGGHVLVAGSFRGGLDIVDGAIFNGNAGSTDWDVFLLKLDPSGKPLWGKGFGDGDRQIADAVRTDGAGNAILVGAYKSTLDFGETTLQSTGDEDAFVAKLGP